MEHVTTATFRKAIADLTARLDALEGKPAEQVTVMVRVEDLVDISRGILRCSKDVVWVGGAETAYERIMKLLGVGPDEMDQLLAEPVESDTLPHIKTTV